MNFRERMTTMKRLLLALGLATLLSVAAWSQEESQEPEETETDEAAEVAETDAEPEEDVDDADLDEQGRRTLASLLGRERLPSLPTVTVDTSRLGAALGLGFSRFMAGMVPPESPIGSPPVYDPFTLVTIVVALILIVVLLNLLAVWIRGRLRRKFQTVHV